MLLNAAAVDEIRQMIVIGREGRVVGLSWDAITLGGALELTCFEHEIQNSPPLIEALARWAEAFPLLEEARRALQHRGVSPVSESLRYDAPMQEITPTPLPDQFGGREWTWFLMRFKRSLDQEGFGNLLSNGLAAALEEMADNASRHSGPTKARPASGIVGYHVANRRMTFAVSDIGRGVLNSLRLNPNYSTLRTSVEALQAAIYNRATSQVDKTYGDGFLELHQALIDLNGQLRFRSGDGLLRADGRFEERRYESVHLPPAQGFQLTVHCALDGGLTDTSFSEL